MPISYEAAAPVASIGAVAQQTAQIANRRAMAEQQNAALAAAATHGNRQYGDDHGPGIQDAILARDNLQFREQQQVQNTQLGYDTQRMQHEAAMSQDQQRFQLQAQLHDVELSQTERMRLQRLKNSVGMVSSDPSLTDEEKADYISQIKYNIDPLQRRMAQEKLQQEKLVKDAMVENKRQTAAINQEHAKFLTQKFDDNVYYHVPQNIMANIVKDMKDSLPMSEMIPPQLLEKMARDEAMRQGLGTHMYQKKFGEWEELGGGKGHGTDGGKDDGSNHPTGLSVKDYAAQYEKAVKEAEGEQKMTSIDENGLKKGVHPQTVEWKNERIKQILTERGLPSNIADYNKGLTQQRGAKQYKSAMGAPVAAAATGDNGMPAPERKPFDFNKPETPQQKADVTAFDNLYGKINMLKGPHDQKQEAMLALTEAKAILTDAGGFDRMTVDEKQKYQQLMNKIAGVKKAAEQPPTPAADQPGPPVVGWWERQFQGYGTTPRRPGFN